MAFPKAPTPGKINKSDFEADQMDEEFFGEIIVLDDFFENLDNLNLLKIDVDGFDYKVLQGCRNLILDHKPIIFIELGEKDLNKNGDSVVDIVNFFVLRIFKNYYITSIR